MSALTKDENPPGGTIPDQALENLLPLWTVAVAGMAASIFMVTPLISDALKRHDYAPLLALAFPAAGLGLLLWALRRTLRIRKFGRSILHVNTIPAMPGGDLAGAIHVERPVLGDPPMRLRLRCIQRRRQSSTKSSTTETVLWQELQKLDHVPRNLEGTDIPIRFHIPADAQTTTGFDWGREILWRLEARGKSGLVNYFARFEVPVGLVPVEEATPLPPPRAHRRDDAASDPRAQLREKGIACQPLEGGGLHLHLNAARRKPIVPTVFGLIFTGLAVALFLAPIGLMRIVSIALGSLVLLPGAFFDYIAIYVWLVSQDVKVQRGSLVMERRALFFHWGRTFDVGDIADITCKEDGMSSTSNNPVVVTFHGIQLTARDGKSTWLASEISQADYAAWLTDEINDALGLSS
jgi:hypothetical protein